MSDNDVKDQNAILWAALDRLAIGCLLVHRGVYCCDARLRPWGGVDRDPCHRLEGCPDHGNPGSPRCVAWLTDPGGVPCGQLADRAAEEVALLTRERDEALALADRLADAIATVQKYAETRTLQDVGFEPDVATGIGIAKARVRWLLIPVTAMARLPGPPLCGW